ncbi:MULTISPECIES: hypothetical protein [Paenibacillus]|uniref:hypothetical protein n=1 Tax=Paenibacillus TaxID=44249 RepID=UPI002FE37124
MGPRRPWPRAGNEPGPGFGPSTRERTRGLGPLGEPWAKTGHPGPKPRVGRGQPQAPHAQAPGAINWNFSS